MRRSFGTALVNLCRARGGDFGSVHAFDRHRIGKHEYTFSIHDASRFDGRRCDSGSESCKGTQVRKQVMRISSYEETCMTSFPVCGR